MREMLRKRNKPSPDDSREPLIVKQTEDLNGSSCKARVEKGVPGHGNGSLGVLD
jgi:hypothetical protein